MSIYITGDCHGDYRRFNTENFPEQKEMTKDDYVIICGDFGYWDESNNNKYWMAWLDDKPFTTLWVDGNHENYDLISKLPVSDWHGGKVQYIHPSVIHLMRGQLYDIEGLKLFSFGGARSHDIDAGILEMDDPLFKSKKKRFDREHLLYRINHVSWWKEEMPSAREMEEGLKNLQKNDFSVDFIVTHCSSSSTQAILSMGTYVPDELTDYFEKIKTMTKFKKWFFGHYHENKNVTADEICLYEQVIQIV